MKTLLCTLLFFCTTFTFMYSQTSGKNRLVRNNDAPNFYLGVGGQLNIPYYTLKTFDPDNSLADNVVVSGFSCLATGRVALAFNPGALIQFSLATYPGVGGAILFNDPGTRLTYDFPLLAEVFFGKRGKGWGAFIGGGITASGISNTSREYPSEIVSDVFSFSPHMFGFQADGGIQFKDALIRLSFSKGSEKPFGNVVTHISDKNKNYSFTVGLSAIYQIPDWRKPLS